MFFNHKWIAISFAVFYLACSSNGGGKKKKSSTDDDAPQSTSSTQPTAATSGDDNPDGFSLVRTTPEQYSNSLLDAAGFDRFRYQDEFRNVPADDLLDQFGVSLGGIDFDVSSVRDRDTKAQTLLIGRILSMYVAKNRLNSEFWDVPSNRVIFTEITNFFSDTPGTSNFTDQVNELFWRFYSRPATAAEVTAVESTWNATFAAESTDKEMRAWTIVLYSILAAQEFWYL